MKKYIIILFVIWMLPFTGMAQNGDSTVEKDTVVTKKKDKLERDAFDNYSIVDNASNLVLKKNTLEIQFQHRFGELGSWDDLGGIYGAANIRIGAAFGIHERLTIGAGTTKYKRYLDLNWKLAILRQTRSGKMPVSLTYFGDFGYDAREQSKANGKINYAQDRYSYFHQLILARRFSPEFSLQATGSVSHFNVVEEEMENDAFAFSLSGRYKISPQTAIIMDYSQPITSFGSMDPEPGFSLGVELGTSAHIFQIFVSNYWGILQQDNYMFNQNDFFGGDILIGFNITRLYNF